MVECNLGRRSPAGLLDLTSVEELSMIDRGQSSLRIGSTATFSRIINEIVDSAPCLTAAARTVGSVQIRNRASIGGNIATASPAGDALPALIALGATVELASHVSGTRTVALEDFLTGPKQSILRSDELIVAVNVPLIDGPQHFAKVGTRTAMVISVCSFALVIDRDAKRVRTCIGSAGPTPIRARDAEQILEDALVDSGSIDELSDVTINTFAVAAAAAARPIDDVRGTAVYRRHAVGVLARRLLARASDEAGARAPGGRPR